MIRADFRPRKGQIRTDHEMGEISEYGMLARLASDQAQVPAGSERAMVSNQ